LAALGILVTKAAASGGETIVVYNDRVPESKALAARYAERRGVPLNRLLGLDLPVTEAISRTAYREQLEEPILEAVGRPRTSSARGQVAPEQAGSAVTHPSPLDGPTVRYVVLCYGVPVRSRGIRC
jgi:uncharacterized protein (TIGR03790 family)